MDIVHRDQPFRELGRQTALTDRRQTQPRLVAERQDERRRIESRPAAGGVLERDLCC